jgi:tRNA(fMet)-specific endonuclease VapC
MEFLLPFTILDFDYAAATSYGIIRSIGSMDLLLAAQARSRNLTMVTNNEKELRRVEGLEIENWVSERGSPAVLFRPCALLRDPRAGGAAR